MQVGSESEGVKILGNVLALLEQLKKSSVGTVIFDQVAQLIEEHRQVQTRLDQAYSMLLHMLLESYARNPDAESVTRINAQLIGLRDTHRAAEAPGPEQQAAPAGETATGAPVAPEPPPVPAREAEAAAAPSHTAAERPGTTETDVGEELSAEAAAPAYERRVHSAYRLHLDRKRDEIEKLQEQLAVSVAEAIAQNREFGALLQIELSALQQAETHNEIEELKQILVGGIEELIQGQRTLDAKLHRTGDYLKLVKSDAQDLRDELHKVRLLSLTDEFTGLANRRAFMRRLQDEIGRAQRYGSSLVLALLDLDEFKAINDVYGHTAGDEVLRSYAQHVLSILRHHDMVARYGGEEFAVLLPNTDRDGAVAAISKVRNRALELRCEYGGKLLPVPTFSAGLTVYAPGESPKELIDRADRALYRAKHMGRNRTEVELPPSPVGLEAEITEQNP
jgi:diguanylate cyclase (GGDEF)-like protein